VTEPTFIELGLAEDHRGRLEFAEYPSRLPFLPQRLFVISEVPAGAIRGEHAHSSTSQILICTSGSLIAHFYDGSSNRQFELSPSSGWLLVPPMNFGKLTHFSKNCVLVVMASEAYRADEYISDLDEFKRLVTKETK